MASPSTLGPEPITSARSPFSKGSSGRRPRRRRSSMRRRWAMVKTQPRKASSSPEKRGRFRTTDTKTSAATSSWSAMPWVRRKPSTRGAQSA